MATALARGWLQPGGDRERSLASVIQQAQPVCQGYRTTSL